MSNIKAISSFHIFSPFGVVILLLLFLLSNIKPIFYGIEIFLILNYAYRYVPAIIYMFRYSSIKKKLDPLPVKNIPFKNFILLVPAKNEANALPNLLASIKRQDYPNEHYKTVIIADNCTDNTAEVAMAHGAECIEKRTRDLQPCKGACIAYAAKIFTEQTLPPDTYVVIIDADCELDISYLTEVNKKLNEPAAAPVLQSYRYVKNRDASVVASLDAASENVRQLVVLANRDMLGLNAFLHGSGTIYEKSVFLKMALTGSTSAAEDKEWNAWLLENEIAIQWCPSAKLNYSVYERNEEFQKQRIRWIRGQFMTARKFAARALLQGILKKNLSQIDYSFSLYQLPRSVLIFLTLLCCMVNYAYFGSVAWALGWLFLSISTVLFEMLGLEINKMSYKELAITAFKMVWGVARSSFFSSINIGAHKLWPERSEIYKRPAK